ncbi:MAG TPA: ATP-binding protein, partial [Pseudobdellovibrionaceae bacterium]|nr:ATP-binding protein [Pseudobdellovibrionaceae bacterium]
SFSLSQLLLDITYVHKERCLQKNLKMIVEKEGEVSEYILSDPVRLKQILQNIIGNAVKFTSSGTINLTYKIQDDSLVFLVQDTGPGISNTNAQKLFQPFSQGDPSLTKIYGGTGLGLMISRKLAHMLGGDVKLLNSELRKGSTFEIRVQYKPSIRKSQRNTLTITSNSAPKIPDLSNKKILVVEDSEDNRLLIQLYLLKSGALVDFATNGQEGVNKALTKNFDAVLMDIQMPIMDGFTATQILRKSGFTLPIIALSAYAMKEDQDKSLQMGCSDYLSKPVDRFQLLNLLEQHVRSPSA